MPLFLNRLASLLHPAKAPPHKRAPKLPVLVVLPETGNFPALPFRLVRDRYRTLRITVGSDAVVTVKVPFQLGMAEVLQAMARKRDWIEGKRAMFQLRMPPRRYQDGEIFYYLGRPFALRLDELAASNPGGLTPCRRPPRLPVAQLSGKELVVRGTTLTPDRTRYAIESWRRRTDLLFFDKRLRRLHAMACQALRDDLSMPGLKVRALKRRWGSCVQCTHGGYEITLARHLSSTPLKSVDYVILHELCHMRSMDHSSRFHALLARLLPDAAARARRLQVWGLEHPRD